MPSFASKGKRSGGAVASRWREAAAEMSNTVATSQTPTPPAPRGAP
jgi:hypothetical protein